MNGYCFSPLLKTAACIAIFGSVIACGGTSDATIGKSRGGIESKALEEGDLCPASKCEDDAIACGPTADGQAQAPTNVRCVAGPQEGSGVGVCHLEADCAPASTVLKEGDPCPADKCAGQDVACASTPDGSPSKATNVRCVAGPQVGSGVGACRLAHECEAQ